jgi:hypothetical protein
MHGLPPVEPRAMALPCVHLELLPLKSHSTVSLRSLASKQHVQMQEKMLFKMNALWFRK